MNKSDDRPALVLAAIITVAWVVSFCVDLFVPTYDAPPVIMPLMLAVAGYLFGRGALKDIKQPGPPPPPDTAEEADKP